MSARLELDAVHIAYGGLHVLRGVSLRVMPGEIVGLIGPNGAGKSTLMRCACGMEPADAGVVRVDGHDMATAGFAARSALGYCVPPTSLPDELSGRQCISLIARARGVDALPEPSLALARTLGLHEWLAEDVGTYSLGTRQKLSIVLACVGEPALLLLDEALNGLDPISALAFKRYLVDTARRTRCGVLLATHGVDVAAHFLDRVLVLDGGIVTREWDRDALATLRAEPGGLESAVVEQLLRSRAP